MRAGVCMLASAVLTCAMCHVACLYVHAAMERQLGCLVGANAYLTPKGSQGLAPHHDDVELWVVQTAGKKKWRLYKPVNAYQLPNQPSGDLEQVGAAADDERYTELSNSCRVKCKRRAADVHLANRETLKHRRYKPSG